MSERKEALMRAAVLLREIREHNYWRDVTAYMRVAVNYLRVVCKCGMQDKPADELGGFALVYWLSLRSRIDAEESIDRESVRNTTADPDTIDLVARVADCIEAILPVTSIFEKAAASPTTEKNHE